MSKIMKSFLKKSFSHAFLKQSFLFYNHLKIKTWDKFFYPELSLQTHDFVVLKEKNPFLEVSVNTNQLPVEVQKGLRLWKDPNWMQDQYLLKYNKEAFIEPKVGWSFTPNRQLIYPSLGFSRASYVHKPDFWEFYFTEKKSVELDKVVSLRDTGEENYFHFFNDILAKIFFLQDHGVKLDGYTFLISRPLFEKDYFQYYYLNTWLSTLNWYVQEDEWIRCKEAIFCKPFTHTKRYLDKAIDLLPKSSPVSNGERVFLNRKKSTLRYVKNIEELAPELLKEGFELVDASDLTFIEQVKLFGNTQNLIAIHGAGITNILFRRNQPLSLLEVFHPHKYAPFHYILLAGTYKYEYDAISGSEMENGGFYVSVEQVKSYLKKLK